MTAWEANQPVVLGGSLFFLDVVFRGVKLEKCWLDKFCRSSRRVSAASVG
jgi:hypothetical protein